jgi:hypothetical protein
MFWYEEKDEFDPHSSEIYKPTAVIIFKWNKNIKELKDCDTKHMLYLLWLSLLKVRQRATEQNKYFKSLGRMDINIKYINNPQIISNFIE